MCFSFFFYLFTVLSFFSYGAQIYAQLDHVYLFGEWMKAVNGQKFVTKRSLCEYLSRYYRSESQFHTCNIESFASHVVAMLEGHKL